MRTQESSGAHRERREPHAQDKDAERDAEQVLEDPRIPATCVEHALNMPNASLVHVHFTIRSYVVGYE